jgi:S1-C subfamily serine protease
VRRLDGDDSPRHAIDAPASLEGVLTYEHALCVVRAAQGTASGFVFLERRSVVTARHVVAEQPADEPVMVLFGRQRTVPARVAFLHPRVDLAVLELLADGPCGTPLCPGGSASSSGPLLCVGYKPSASDAAGGRYNSFVTSVPRFERTTRQRDGHEERLFMFPAPDGEPGHSGGPVLAADGSVLGVVINGITMGGAHYVRATAIDALLEHLPLRAGGRP